MASIEDLLLYKAQQDAASKPTVEEAVLTGAPIGALVGVAAGNTAHNIGKGINKLTGHTPGRFVAGNRMAGGLVGAILGGTLGAGVRNMMIQDSPAAALLAKAQTGELTQTEVGQLEAVLNETYQQMGLR